MSRLRTRSDFGIAPGVPGPLGATLSEYGVNFALSSPEATAVWLCIFDEREPLIESARIPLSKNDDGIWHIFVEGLRAGQPYGYRVAGPYNPALGQRFNENKLLQDPYAQGMCGELSWNPALFGYGDGDPLSKTISQSDSAPFVPRSIVLHPTYSRNDDHFPKIPWSETVIYEAHVKGFTQLHPLVPKNLRGTYAALGSAPIIDHLKRLGVTTLELLPIQFFVDEQHLQERGLKNYWGYNPLNYFSPSLRYATEKNALCAQQELRDAIAALHQHRIEVVLDVVFNHTAESDHSGPTLCYRGIANNEYYVLQENRSFYENYTGCGNVFRADHPLAEQLIVQALRHWRVNYHIDGFRFDLATTLGRRRDEFSNGSLLTAISRDPDLQDCKLIAEPWDIGPNGYQVGNFPAVWSEWNDRYRDDVRDFWRGERYCTGRLATRLAGSSDVFWAKQSPLRSINFITAHDGFSLRDVTSYNEKHNDQNGEGNRDGHNDNRSWNCGTEGCTQDAAIETLRTQQIKNFFLTLFFSAGVPMIRSGDELGQTQQGNNNAYCQDSELTWIPWNTADEALCSFVGKLSKLRQSFSCFQRDSFFRGKEGDGNITDLSWWHPSGIEMQSAHWQEQDLLCIGACHCNMHRQPELFIVCNAGESRDFRLPQTLFEQCWKFSLSTIVSKHRDSALLANTKIDRGQSVRIPAHSALIFTSEEIL